MTTLERTMDAALYGLGSPFSDRVYKEDVRLYAEVDDFLELHAEGLTRYQRHQREAEEHPEWDTLAFYRTASFGKLKVYYFVNTKKPYDNVRPVIRSIVRYGDILESLTVVLEEDGGYKPLFSYWVDGDTIAHVGPCQEYVDYSRKEVEDDLYRDVIANITQNRDGPTTLRLEG